MKHFLRHTTLRTRISLYFASGFLLLWLIVSLIFFANFSAALSASFDDQLRARATVVAQRTSVSPKIIPLPQGEESFSIVYQENNKTDTLFSPARQQYLNPLDPDSVRTNNGWRIVKTGVDEENGGRLLVYFALPSEGLDARIREMELLILFVLPVGFLLAVLLSRWLTYLLLKPVNQVIALARATNLNQDVELLKEPDGSDELKEMVVSFNRMLLRINEQSGRQTAFFASASHELRTPLSVMQTRLEVLMHATGDSDIIFVYAEQLKDVRRLIKLVNEFLLLSELKNGIVCNVFTPCNLSDVIIESMTKFKDSFSARALQVRMRYHPVEEVYEVVADEARLSVIIDNLLDNAVKYSPAGSVIDISLEKKQADITLLFANEIRDDINPVVSDLKDEFYHSKPLHGEGFGLGLWISNQLALLQSMEMDFSINELRHFEAKLTCSITTPFQNASPRGPR